MAARRSPSASGDRQTSIFCLERSAGLEQFRKGLGEPCRGGAKQGRGGSRPGETVRVSRDRHRGRGGSPGPEADPN